MGESPCMLWVGPRAWRVGHPTWRVGARLTVGFFPIGASYDPFSMEGSHDPFDNMFPIGGSGCSAVDTRNIFGGGRG